MSLTLVMLLIGALLILVIAISLVQQHRNRLEGIKRQELAKQRAVIDESEQILSLATSLPFSNGLLTILNQRVLEALQISLEHDPKNTDLNRYKSDTQTQLNNLAKLGDQFPSLDSFIVPNNDKQTLTLVQTLKRLKLVLRSEYNRSRVSPELYTLEDQRIEVLQLRINATVLCERSRRALNDEQLGTAKQLLAKAITVLSPAQENPVFAAMLEQAYEMQAEVEKRQQATLHEIISDEPEENELDKLFEPKKKW